MTEISTYLSGSPTRPRPRARGLCPTRSPHRDPGRPGPPRPARRPRELAVSTDDPGLMRGYLGEAPPQGPGFAPATWPGWPGRRVTHLGRKDDLLNAGGFRVSPSEVEAAFHDIPGLQACAATRSNPPRHHDPRPLLRSFVRHRRKPSAPARRKGPCPLEAAKALPAP
jgi:acyl-coenzyme A synthetase/AMP-(fatty) acid ligase